jgi:oxygen-independent coproporphyrinogen-3 oxidase
MHITKDFFEHTFHCDKNCSSCTYCREYWESNRPSGKKKKTGALSEFIDKVLRQHDEAVPDGIDLSQINVSWEKVPGDFRDWERSMPSPVWKEKGLAYPRQESWSILKDQLPESKEGSISVYLHIPFCDRRCNFCDCNSVYSSRKGLETFNSFTQKVISEIDFWTSETKLVNRPLTTVHFGGGTPNYLPLKSLQSILSTLHTKLQLSESTELALESTSTLLTEGHLKQLKAMGFTRLHVGVQSLDDSVRRILGRKERSLEVLQKLQQSLDLGFITSVDIIFGLPGQSMHSLLKTLELLDQTGIHGISLYQLNITDRNRRFFSKLENFTRDPMHDFLLLQSADQYLIRRAYKKNHFVHYARESDKNLYYNHVRRGEDLLAIGPTADGIFNDFYYMHDPVKNFMRVEKENSPLLLGGGFLSAEEKALRPIIASLMTASVPASRLTSSPFLSLFEQWQQSGLLYLYNSEYILSGTGSWFITQMIESLKGHALQ